jgi:hypothetical protein
MGLHRGRRGPFGDLWEASMKRGTPDHPKVYALAEALGIRRPAALGHLELLFHFAAQYAPRGDAGRYPDKRIAAATGWPGKAEKLIESLVTTGWLDRGFRSGNRSAIMTRRKKSTAIGRSAEVPS